jgi:hypothetical protein
MAAQDTFEESFTERAHVHTSGALEAVLTIPTVIDRHYALALVVCAQGNGGASERQSFQRGLQIQNNGGTVAATLSTATDEDNDPNATGYTIDVLVSGTDVQVRVATAINARSAARAIGLSFEFDIGGE